MYRIKQFTVVKDYSLHWHCSMVYQYRYLSGTEVSQTKLTQSYFLGLNPMKLAKRSLVNGAVCLLWYESDSTVQFRYWTTSQRETANIRAVACSCVKPVCICSVLFYLNIETVLSRKDLCEPRKSDSLEISVMKGDHQSYCDLVICTSIIHIIQIIDRQV